ncbi:MAG: nitroreductase family deazaflavin-dependent oxidoreductase [Myxococcota bacterium]|nr:nitroreductase family deazaflavin-dependent oxidoreductase [Myxococcota bacterium]
MYSRFVNWLSATPFGSWLVKHVASPIDPWIFRVTGGRFTSTGVPTLPMITVETIGRRSGETRPVQLAFHEEGGELFVVASAMGQEKHPAWRYNLEAHPEVWVQARGERFVAKAQLLSDEEKQRIWPAIHETIPQMRVYEQRTDRNIGVFRLTRVE